MSPRRACAKATAGKPAVRSSAGSRPCWPRTIDELDLSVRSINTLKNANIHTLRDLVRRSEKDMLEAKGFGKKSLEELQEVLEKLGLSLGMEVPERPSGAGVSV
jgi:DNA-directed RNA polymerase subunit alpha